MKDACHWVVGVGGGFAGLEAARKLARLPVEVALVDRRNYYLFRPLAYQVTTGAQAPGEAPRACDHTRAIAARLRRLNRSIAARTAIHVPGLV